MTFSELTSLSIASAEKYPGVVISISLYALNELRTNTRISTQRKEAAESALAKAFNETEGYYLLLDVGAERSIQAEHKTSSLWDEAAAKFRSINQEIAGRMSAKSGFWRGGAAWSKDEIEAHGITLTEIRKLGYKATGTTI
jgi:hypothetical protein